MKKPAIVGATLLFLCVAGTAGAAPVTYTLQPKRSKLVAHLLKAGAGSRFAHDHVVEARKVSGTVVVDAAAPGRSRISVTVPTRSLRADEPRLRRQYGMKSTLSPKDRQKVEQNMRSRGQLYTARHGSITFVSKKVEGLSRGRYRVFGTLTIRGVSRSVAATVSASVSGATFKGSCQLRVRQSHFGYKPYSAMMGLVSVRDLITINIYLQGRQR